MAAPYGSLAKGLVMNANGKTSWGKSDADVMGLRGNRGARVLKIHKPKLSKLKREIDKIIIVDFDNTDSKWPNK